MDILAELDIDPTLCITTVLNAYKLADLDILEPELRMISVMDYYITKVPIYLAGINSGIISDGEYSRTPS